MFCPKCGTQLPDGAKFCGSCGSALSQLLPQASPQLQTSPQSPSSERVPELHSADKPVEAVGSGDATVSPPPSGDPPAAPAKKQRAGRSSRKNPKPASGSGKKLSPRVWLFGGIALAVVVAAVVLFLVFFGDSGNGSGLPQGVLYLRSGELNYSNDSKNAPWKVTADLLEDGENNRLWYYADEIANTIHVTENGKTMFYLDRLSEGVGTLYCRSLSDMDSKATKISAGVSKYTVSKNGKLVIYLKEGTLYRYDGKDGTKLGRNVTDYFASPNCKIVYYRNGDGVWYSVKNGDSEKIGSDVQIYDFSRDYSTVYYFSDEKLFKKSIGKDKVKLVSEYSRLYAFDPDGGTFYYTKAVSYDMADFFITDGGEYDYLMEYLEQYGSMDFEELYYYNGKTGTRLSDCCTVKFADTNDGSSILAYAICNGDTGDRITTTALYENYWDNYDFIYEAASDMVQELLETDSGLCVAVNGKESTLKLEHVGEVWLSEDGQSLWFLCELEDDEGDLYRATVSGTTVKELEFVDDGIRADRCRLCGSWLTYFKNFGEDGAGELYANGSLVERDAYFPYVEYLCETGELIYYTEYDIYESCATLNSWNGKKVTTLCDNVYSVIDTAEDGQLLLCTDYDSDAGSYTLRLWNGRKLVKVDRDVYDAVFDADGNVAYLIKYDTENCEGTLYTFNGKKSTRITKGVVALIHLPQTVDHDFR